MIRCLTLIGQCIRKFFAFSLWRSCWCLPYKRARKKCCSNKHLLNVKHWDEGSNLTLLVWNKFPKKGLSDWSVLLFSNNNNHLHHHHDDDDDDDHMMTTTTTTMMVIEKNNTRDQRIKLLELQNTVISTITHVLEALKSFRSLLQTSMSYIQTRVGGIPRKVSCLWISKSRWRHSALKTEKTEQFTKVKLFTYLKVDAPLSFEFSEF